MEHYHRREVLRQMQTFTLPVLVTKRMRHQVARRRVVEDLATALIEAAESHDLGINEGAVCSLRPLYRRLDCDGAGLAYIRTRPRLGAVRVDVPTLWQEVEPCRLSVPCRRRSASLLVHERADVEVAVRFLCRVVAQTREWRRAGRRAAAADAHRLQMEAAADRLGEAA